MTSPEQAPDFEAALRLFDETVRALEARARRLEEVLTVKQQELGTANQHLAQKVRELDSLSHYLELVLSSVASGVIAVNREGVITTANPAVRRMCAGMDNALEGRILGELFADSAVDRLLAGEPGPLASQRLIPDRDLGERIIEVVASPIIDASGQVVGAVEVLDDVTDVRRLQDAVQRGERLKSLGEMAAGVAHEIRNPLNGIEGFASLLARDLDPTSRSARHAKAIVEGVRDLNRTVSGLLQFTQQRPPQWRRVPLAEVVKGVHELVQAELIGAEHEHDSSVNVTVIDCEIAPNWLDRSLGIDPSQVRQVLLNLVQNALHAAVSDGASGQPTVRIRLGDGERQTAMITVSDSGPGIPEHQLGEIFTPFFTTKDHGTGLGLAIVHSLIQGHDGEIHVDRDPQLGGARFTITIPDHQGP